MAKPIQIKKIKKRPGPFLHWVAYIYFSFSYRHSVPKVQVPSPSRGTPRNIGEFWSTLPNSSFIAYDILAYPKWTIEQKREELYRVIEASEQKIGRKFTVPSVEAVF